MKVLCVAEKPSIAKSISQILSGGQYSTRNSANKYIKNYDFDYPQTNSQFTVTSVTGHLHDYDFESNYSGWKSCDPFVLFDAPIKKTVKKESQTIARNLTSEARGAQMLMIWTDCDREGENIGAEIADICRQARRNITIRRARFSAIIAQQIHNAAQHPVQLDEAQSNAVEARILLDLRVGAAFTRMQTLALQPRFEQLKEVISYGPCQFPTLGFVVSRYNQVKSFVPESFWYIHLALSRQDEGTGKMEETPFKWRRVHILDFQAARAIYQFLLTDPLARVIKVTNKDTKKWKPLPLTTVDLQKAGSRLLKISPKKVLDIAERLYTQGFLSYPRTETDQFDPQFNFMTLIDKQTVDPVWGQFATGLQNGGFDTPRRGKKNDKAHPPIHPTAHVANLAGDEKKVYEYITRRFLACCSKDALGWETTIEVECGAEEFYVTGLIVRERNYLNVFPYDKWSDKELPDFEEGEEFVPSICELKEGQTTRPSLLTEADLVSLMDKNGIGTDATIAQHIQTIIDRKYVIERMQGATKYLVPSTLGIGLVEGYNEIGFDRSLSKPELRRETERQMVQICEGHKTKGDMLIENIERYKEMYMRTKQDFGRIAASVGNRLQGNEIDYEADFLDIAVGGGGGGDGGNGGGGRGARGGRGGRGGRGTGVTRGSTASRRGRGGSAAGRTAAPPDDNDLDMLDDDPPPPPPRGRVTKKTPVSALASAPRPPAPASATSTARTPAASTSTLPSGAFTSAGNTQAAIGSEKRCECGAGSGNQAVQRAVVKEGANKGRLFWTCAKDRDAQCGFWEWADDGAGGNHNGRTSGTGTSSGECFKCGQKGHWANACPGTGSAVPSRARSSGTQIPAHDNSSSSNSCFKCGRPGHFANACPGGGSGVASGSRNVGSSVECFKCHESGHYSNACPNGATGSNRMKRSSSSSGGRAAKRGRVSARGSTTKRGRKKTTNYFDDF